MAVFLSEHPKFTFPELIIERSDVEQTTTPPMEKLEFKLEKEQELRIEASLEKLTLTLLNGTAEILGVELALNKPYNFSNVKIPIFTWHGCSLSLIGKPDVAYVAQDQTPMPSYVNTHAVLQNMRDEAALLIGKIVTQPGASKKDLEHIKGPRVAVVGPQDSGKTSFAKYLASCAVKSGSGGIGKEPPTGGPEEPQQIKLARQLLGRVLMIDLDPGEGKLCPPGMIGASVVAKVDAEEGPLCEPPLTYFIGQVETSTCGEVIKHSCTELSKHVDNLLKRRPELNVGGLIIDTSSWVSPEPGFEFLTHTLKTFNVNVVIVLGAERLYAELSRDFSGKGVQVLHLAKSGGVVIRDARFRQKQRMIQIKSYFYGPHGDLNPFTTAAPFDEVKLLKVVAAPKVPLSALPIGASSTLEPVQVEKVYPGMELQHSLIGLVAHDGLKGVEEDDDRIALVQPSMGMVHVTNVSMEKRQMTFLAPAPGKLPSKYLLMSNIKWLE